MRFVRSVHIGLVIFMLPVAVFAQTSSPHAKVVTQEYRVESRQVQPETYGTTSKSWYVLNARDFLPYDSTTTYLAFDDTISLSGGTSQLVATIRLPAGALLTDIEYRVCDTNATLDIGARLWMSSVADGTLTYINDTPVTTGAPGCGLFSHTYSPAVQIDNDGFTYGLALYWQPSAGLSLRVTSARVGYKLQVSPDPSTATFADVPVGHPFHRFVEALYASGITGGCGGGHFCPDAPVTRGQMAVFLAGALGLHWAP